MTVLRMFQTLRGKLVFSFSLFLALLVAVIAIDYWSRDWRSKIYSIEQRLNEIQLNLSSAKQLEALFFKDETFNPEFYDQGSSEYLDERALLMNLLVEELTILRNSEEIGATNKEEIDNTLADLALYKSTFSEMVDLVIQRGFKDWGVEGEMRDAIHAIEEEKALDLAKVLMIRRHEKDFIMRKDQVYKHKLQIAVADLKEDILKNTSNVEDRIRLLQLLDNYEDKFTRLAILEQQIGFDNNKGLRKSIQELSRKISTSVIQINSEVLGEIHTIDASTRYWSIGLTTFLVLFGVLMAFSMAKSLGKPITELSSAIRFAIQTKFAPEFKVVRIPGNDEIARLSSDVAMMHETIQENLVELKAKSKKIEDKQSLLLDSLRYAEQIQQAILPTPEDLGTYVSEHFVLYRPSQVVSGDFYWLTRRKNKVFIAVADCTGHGVPGAFMSMIGHSLLNKIVMQAKVLEPAVILEVLHLEIQEALQQGKGKMNEDGMDIAVISIETDTGTNIRNVSFSGAKQGLAYTDEGMLHYIPGTKRSIGGMKSARSTKPFVEHQLQMKKNEKLYLFSDGFADQHNPEGRKYGKKILLKFLTHLAFTPFELQHGLLVEELERHQGSQEQRDDITFMGVRL